METEFLIIVPTRNKFVIINMTFVCKYSDDEEDEICEWVATSNGIWECGEEIEEAVSNLIYAHPISELSTVETLPSEFNLKLLKYERVSS